MHDDTTDRVLGAVLGLALGDAFGAPHEGGVLERALWAVLGTRNGKRRWTDDTQMTIDVIESLLACRHIDQDDLARRFAQSYRWSRGYGPGAANVLKRIRNGVYWESAALAAFPGGSFGNGGAMRAPVVGLFYAADSDDDLAGAASDVAAITHAHPLGREGAMLIALATATAFNDVGSLEIITRLRHRCESREYAERIGKAGAWLERGDIISPRRLAAELGNGIAAIASCPTAVYVALAFRERPFDELLEFTIAMGGDVDTIAAMASAIWGAARGFSQLPRARLQQLEQQERLERLAQALAGVVVANRSE
ncbi:MAG: ADP-ribosylglycohydrolase family protein [Gammaproteobacteria bacterium]|nr:ADP-ribosylglycohydrolase family protein [Gammaproteobacteria bacterium]